MALARACLIPWQACAIFFRRRRTSVQAKRLFGVLNSRVGDLASLPGIFSDHPAPIVRNAPDGRQIVTRRPT